MIPFFSGISKVSTRRILFCFASLALILTASQCKNRKGDDGSTLQQTPDSSSGGGSSGGGEETGDNTGGGEPGDNTGGGSSGGDNTGGGNPPPPEVVLTEPKCARSFSDVDCKSEEFLTNNPPPKVQAFTNGRWDYVWIQKGYEGDAKKEVVSNVGWWLRALTKLPTCPPISVDGGNWNEGLMQERVALAPDSLESHDASVSDEQKHGPTRVCQYEIKHGQHTFEVWNDGSGNNQKLFAPDDSSVQKIYVVGDTGRHVLTDAGKEKWEFANITGEIKTGIGHSKHSIVMHVGDYLYSTGAQSPENWHAWEKEFFEPMSGLMDKAAFVFVRGNHEECTKDLKDSYATKGWFWFLDPASEMNFPGLTFDVNTGCVLTTPAYPLKFGAMDLAILDSAGAKSQEEKGFDKYEAQLIGLNNSFAKDSSVTIVTHRPFWVWVPQKKPVTGRIWDPSTYNIMAIGQKIAEQTMTLQKSYSEFLAKGEKSKFRHVLSGHIHLFDFMRFEDPRMNQIIAGNAGLELNGVNTHAELKKINLERNLQGASGKVLQESEPKAPISKHGYVYFETHHTDKLHVCLKDEGCKDYSITNCLEGQHFTFDDTAHTGHCKYTNDGVQAIAEKITKIYSDRHAELKKLQDDLTLNTSPEQQAMLTQLYTDAANSSHFSSDPTKLMAVVGQLSSHKDKLNPINEALFKAIIEKGETGSAYYAEAAQFDVTHGKLGEQAFTELLNAGKDPSILALAREIKAREGYDLFTAAAKKSNPNMAELASLAKTKGESEKTLQEKFGEAVDAKADTAWEKAINFGRSPKYKDLFKERVKTLKDSLYADIDSIFIKTDDLKKQAIAIMSEGEDSILERFKSNPNNFIESYDEMTRLVRLVSKLEASTRGPAFASVIKHRKTASDLDGFTTITLNPPHNEELISLFDTLIKKEPAGSVKLKAQLKFITNISGQVTDSSKMAFIKWLVDDHSAEIASTWPSDLLDHLTIGIKDARDLALVQHLLGKGKTNKDFYDLMFGVYNNNPDTHSFVSSDLKKKRFDQLLDAGIKEELAYTTLLSKDEKDLANFEYAIDVYLYVVNYNKKTVGFEKLSDSTKNTGLAVKSEFAKDAYLTLVKAAEGGAQLRLYDWDIKIYEVAASITHDYEKEIFLKALDTKFGTHKGFHAELMHRVRAAHEMFDSGGTHLALVKHAFDELKKSAPLNFYYFESVALAGPWHQKQLLKMANDVYSPSFSEKLIKSLFAYENASGDLQKMVEDLLFVSHETREPYYAYAKTRDLLSKAQIDAWLLCSKRKRDEKCQNRVLANHSLKTLEKDLDTDADNALGADFVHKIPEGDYRDDIIAQLIKVKASPGLDKQKFEDYFVTSVYKTLWAMKTKTDKATAQLNLFQVWIDKSIFNQSLYMDAMTAELSTLYLWIHMAERNYGVAAKDAYDSVKKSDAELEGIRSLYDKVIESGVYKSDVFKTLYTMRSSNQPVFEATQKDSGKRDEGFYTRVGTLKAVDELEFLQAVSNNNKRNYVTYFDQHIASFRAADADVKNAFISIARKSDLPDPKEFFTAAMQIKKLHVDVFHTLLGLASDQPGCMGRTDWQKIASKETAECFALHLQSGPFVCDANVKENGFKEIANSHINANNFALCEALVKKGDLTWIVKNVKKIEKISNPEKVGTQVFLSLLQKSTGASEGGYAAESGNIREALFKFKRFADMKEDFQVEGFALCNDNLSPPPQNIDLCLTEALNMKSDADLPRFKDGISQGKIPQIKRTLNVDISAIDPNLDPEKRNLFIDTLFRISNDQNVAAKKEIGKNLVDHLSTTDKETLKFLNAIAGLPTNGLYLELSEKALTAPSKLRADLAEIFAGLGMKDPTHYEKLRNGDEHWIELVFRALDAVKAHRTIEACVAALAHLSVDNEKLFKAAVEHSLISVFEKQSAHFVKASPFQKEVYLILVSNTFSKDSDYRHVDSYVADVGTGTAFQTVIHQVKGPSIFHNANVITVAEGAHINGLQTFALDHVSSLDEVKKGKLIANPLKYRAYLWLVQHKKSEKDNYPAYQYVIDHLKTKAALSLYEQLSKESINKGNGREFPNFVWELAAKVKDESSRLVMSDLLNKSLNWSDEVWKINLEAALGMEAAFEKDVILGLAKKNLTWSATEWKTRLGLSKHIVNDSQKDAFIELAKDDPSFLPKIPKITSTAANDLFKKSALARRYVNPESRSFGDWMGVYVGKESEGLWNHILAWDKAGAPGEEKIHLFKFLIEEMESRTCETTVGVHIRVTPDAWWGIFNRRIERIKVADKTLDLEKNSIKIALDGAGCKKK